MTYAVLSVDNCFYSTSQKHVKYVSKTPGRLANKNSLTWWYVLKTSWRFLKDIFARRLENVLKTSSRRLEDVLKMFLQDVLKMSRRRLEDVSLRWIYWSWSRRLQDASLRRMFAEKRTLKNLRKTSTCLSKYLKITATVKKIFEKVF